MLTQVMLLTSSDLSGYFPLRILDIHYVSSIKSAHLCIRIHSYLTIREWDRLDYLIYFILSTFGLCYLLHWQSTFKRPMHMCVILLFFLQLQLVHLLT